MGLKGCYSGTACGLPPNMKVDCLEQSHGRKQSSSREAGGGGRQGERENETDRDREDDPYVGH